MLFPACQAHSHPGLLSPPQLVPVLFLALGDRTDGLLRRLAATSMSLLDRLVLALRQAVMDPKHVTEQVCGALLTQLHRKVRWGPVAPGSVPPGQKCKA